jgi:hypothetical protein
MLPRQGNPGNVAGVASEQNVETITGRSSDCTCDGDREQNRHAETPFAVVGHKLLLM